MAHQFICRIGGTLDPNAQLTQAEQENNAFCIYDRMSGYGWSLEAISGMCGCFAEESHFNPGIYETSHGGTLSNLPYFPGGMGLGQWTDYLPYTSQRPNPLPYLAQQNNKNWYDGDFQCFLFTKSHDYSWQDMGLGDGELWGWLTSSSYPSQPFETFIHSHQSVADAVTYWFYDWEWHWSEEGYKYLPQRIAWGEYYYQLFSGHTPEPPGPGPGPEPTPTTHRKMPLWMYLKPYYLR